MIRIRLLIIYSFIALTTKSQVIDTNYINFFPYEGTVYSYLINKNNNLKYTNIERNYSIYYYPNSWGSFGIGGSYKWLDLSLGLLSYGIKDEKIYGKTSRIDIQSHLYPRNYIIDGFFQYYNSFYSNSYIVTKDKNDIYVRSDISMAQAGGNLLRILKPDKFSPKAVFSQSEIQKKSVGTWVVGSKITVFAISSDSAFTPNSLDTIFTKDFKLLSFSSIMAGIQGGYMYNWKKKHWLINISAIFGLGSQFQQKTLASQPNRSYPHATTGIITNIRLAVSYSKNRTYFIFSAITDNCQYPLNNYIRIDHIFGRIDIVYGYRLFNNSKKIVPN